MEMVLHPKTRSTLARESDLKDLQVFSQTTTRVGLPPVVGSTS